jgi:subtilisin family serine protease
MPILTSRSVKTFLSVTIALTGFLTAALQLGAPGSPGQGKGPGRAAPYVEGEVIVKFKKDAGPSDRANLRAQIAQERRRSFRSGAEHWKLPPGRNVEREIARFRGNPHIEYIEPNYLVEIDRVPDDPHYPEMYGLNNTGQTGGTPGADIDAEMAWNLTTGSHAVLVAVIDTGVDYNHVELASNIFVNAGETPGNGLDDDGNGFVDDVHGWDFVNNDSDPIDDNGHGTHVAGTIGAVGNNAIGVTGVNWEVSIVPLKFLNAGGSGSTAGAIAAVEYATLIGVDIMNNSWGGGAFSQALLDAINAAAAADILFVASAGNGGTNTDINPHYPSTYDAANIVSVASTDDDDLRASSSNYGATSVDLGAPGVNILSTLPGGGYGYKSGTSMASPHVAGTAALVRALSPSIGVSELKQRLLDFTEPVSSLAGITVTGGRLNAFLPIATADDVPPGAILDLASSAQTSNSIVLDWTATGDDGEEGLATSYDLRYATEPIDASNFAMASRVSPIPVPGPAGTLEIQEVFDLQPATTYFFAVTARDEWGNTGPLSNVASATTLPPPTLASSPVSFSADLRTGEQTTRILTIENAGLGTLDWRIPLRETTAPPAGGALVAMSLGKGYPDPRIGAPVTEGFGGPDSFGYRFLDSDEPGGPSFIWNDIMLKGVPIASLTGDDETSDPIPLGFDVSFYGNTFDSVMVSTNGWLSFTDTDGEFTNQPLPGLSAPGNLVAPFWDDLDFQGEARAYYLGDGSRFTVQYVDVPRFLGPGTYTFQVTIHATGRIEFHYLWMTGTTSQATVGIQDGSRTSGLQIAFNSGYVRDELAVQIGTEPFWLTASPTEGRLSAGERLDVVVTIDAGTLAGGSYHDSVLVQSNDPLRPIVAHVVTLGVTDAPVIALEPDALEFDIVFLGFARTIPLIIRNIGTAPLSVSEIRSDHPALTISTASLTVPPGSEQSVNVTYARRVRVFSTRRCSSPVTPPMSRLRSFRSRAPRRPPRSWG